MGEADDIDYWTRVQLEIAFSISNKNTAPDEVDCPAVEDLPKPEPVDELDT